MAKQAENTFRFLLTKLMTYVMLYRKLSIFALIKIKIKMNTEYIKLTELWQDGQFTEVANTINNEEWNPARVAEFVLILISILALIN